MVIGLGKQMKKLTFIILFLHVPHAAVKLLLQTVDEACNDSVLSSSPPLLSHPVPLYLYPSKKGDEIMETEAQPANPHLSVAAASLIKLANNR